MVRTGHKASAGRAGKVVELHRPADTRDRVLAAAQTLFAENGYRGTGLRDIARKIGIRAPSLLHHFPSKEQLYLAVLDRIFEGLEDSASMVLMGRNSHQDRMRRAITGAIDYIAGRPDSMRIIWREMIEQSAISRQIFKRRIPPLFAMGVNFIFQGQRAGEFRPEVDPFHFLLSLNSITLGYFTTAAMVRRLWGQNLVEGDVIDRRKREVIDLVERTLFQAAPAPDRN
ncbi:MAG TPA: TetR/AcrR family transcriptional regulator [Candidatus Binataceae bacterium]|nr:TetR/AcrR family transcriptional regulator [Candidatus Binataceae bacterium]